MAQLVHISGTYKGYDHGPVPASVCGNKVLDELLRDGETYSSRPDRVNCPDCRARTIRYEEAYDAEDYEPGDLILVWPTAGPYALPAA